MAVNVSLLNSTSKNNINTNFQRVASALQDTVSRTGTLPNQMNADLDLNSNNLLNVESMTLKSLLLNGVAVVPTELSGFPPESIGSDQLIDGSIEGIKIASEAIDDSKISLTSKLYNRINDVVFARDFGAKGDGKVISTTTTNGSAIITANAATFAITDIGKVYRAQYGLIGDLPLQGTITSYISPTQVTLSTNATANSVGPAIYGTNDTVALQSAITAAATKQAEVVLGWGLFLSNSLNAAQWLSIRGANQNTSGIVLIGSTNSIIYRGTGTSSAPYATPMPSVQFSSMFVKAAYALNTSDALIDVEFNYGGSPYRYGIFENVLVGCLGSGMMSGVRLSNCSNFSINQMEIAGNGGLVSGSIGLIIEGLEKPIDMYAFGLKVHFFNYAVKINGASTFTDVAEGIVFVSCLFIVNTQCVVIDSDTPFPYIAFHGCNLNGVEKDIVARNVAQLHLSGNLFYSLLDVAGDHTAVEIVQDAALSIKNGNKIVGNIFSAQNSPTKTSRGITIQASVNTINTSTQIGENTFLDYDFGIILYSNANNIYINDTNIYPGTTVQVLDSGVNNSVANASLNTEGRSSTNVGVETKWGNASVVLDASKRAIITFPVAFKSACYNVQVTNSFADGLSAHAIVADAKTLSKFEIYVAEGTVGDNKQVDWVAIGN